MPSFMAITTCCIFFTCCSCTSRSLYQSCSSLLFKEHQYHAITTKMNGNERFQWERAPLILQMGQSDKCCRKLLWWRSCGQVWCRNSLSELNELNQIKQLYDIRIIEIRVDWVDLLCLANLFLHLKFFSFLDNLWPSSLASEGAIGYWWC